jgi:predicted NAD/FAD-dependent oxidoreductase
MRHILTRNSRNDSGTIGEMCSPDSPKAPFHGTPGGIGGASAAYFVRQLCGKDVSIHVFESQDVGGRLKSMMFEGSPYELGGSMVYQDNIYIRCCPHACAHLKLGDYSADVRFQSSSPGAVQMRHTDG